MSGVALRSVLGATLVAGTMLPARASDEVLVAAPAATPPAPVSPRSAAPSAPARERPAVLLAYMQDALEHVSRLADAARADRDVIRLNCLDEKLTAVKGLVQISRALVSGAEHGAAAGATTALASSSSRASATTDASRAASVAAGSDLASAATTASRAETVVAGSDFPSATTDASRAARVAPGSDLPGAAATVTRGVPGPARVARLGVDDLVIAHRKCAQLRAEAEACIGVLSDYPGGTRRETIVDGPRAADPTTRTGDVIWLERPPAASPYQ